MHGVGMKSPVSGRSFPTDFSNHHAETYHSPLIEEGRFLFNKEALAMVPSLSSSPLTRTMHCGYNSHLVDIPLPSSGQASKTREPFVHVHAAFAGASLKKY